MNLTWSLERIENKKESLLVVRYRYLNVAFELRKLQVPRMRAGAEFSAVACRVVSVIIVE